jgi:hypothetical protein
VSSPLKIPSSWTAWVVVLLVLRVFATLGAPVWLWGLDSLADRSPQWWLLLLGFALPLSAPLMLKVGSLVSRLMERSGLVPLYLAAALGALFALFRSTNFLLGDSLLYVHALREGIQIESAGRREAGATLVVSGLHWTLSKTALTGSLVPFVAASVVAGIIYVLLAFVISHTTAAASQSRGLVFASLLALGGLQIFFGHAEYYSLVAASGMLYIYLSIRWLKGGGSLLHPALALALSLFVHVMNTILVLSFVWLLFRAVRRGRHSEAVAAALVVPLLLASVAVIIHYPWDSLLAIFSRGKHMLPFIHFDHEFYAYAVFSPAHLVELANILLLASPCLPLLLLAAGRPRRGPGEEAGGGLAGLLAFVALGAAAFTLLANPALGMARDWDIFAFPFMLMTLALSAAAARRLTDKRHILWLCGTITVIGTLHLALFVGGNRARSAYVPRFTRIAMAENLFAPTPRAELWRYLGWEALNMGDNEQAKDDLRRSIRDFTTQVKAYKMLAVVDIGSQFDWLASGKGSARRKALGLETEGQVTEEAARLGLAQYYTWAEKEAPNKVRAYLGAGVAAISVGAADSLVVDAFKRAVEADPEDLEARAFWGDMLRSHGLTDRAEEQYDWVLSKRRWHARATLGKACILGMRGEPEMAYVMVKELRDHYPWSIEAQQYLLARRDGKLATPDDFRTFMVSQ